MRMIDDWRLWWRRWTTWLAAIAGGIAAAVVASPSLLLGLVGYVPEDWRGPAAAGVGALVFIAPILLNNLKQEKLDAHRTDGQP